MKEPKQNRKTRYTRMVLQESLLELMVQKPISKITIKELCEKADVNRTTFYAHYQDQYDLLRNIENDTLAWAEERIDTLISKTEKRETIQVLEGILHYFAQNSKYIQVLMSEQGDIDFQKKLLMLIYRKCDITPAEGNSDLRELSFVFVVNGSIGMLQHWLKNNFDKPEREVAEIIYNMASHIV